jgi:TPP-dependent pyruvate/acetoin dehydrogenase alpha subunit
MVTQRLLKLYRQMLVLRGIDEMLLDLKFKDLVMDGFHPYQGQEAIAVGVCSALRRDDVVLSTHRPQGHALAKGSTPRAMFCEMLGRRGGVSQGIGGPMQFIDAANRFFCGSIVGSGMAVATGVAMALKREGRRRIAVCFFGDGASNTGSFHESLNLAAIWQLPVLYVLENNQYGEAMPVQEFVSVRPIARRAAAYGLQGKVVDGMDLEAVAAAAASGVRACRAGRGPVFLEMTTYRYKGHYGGDPEQTYRTKEEVEKWRERDPLICIRARLLAAGVAESELDELGRAVQRDLQADQEWALSQPFPTVEQATDHVMIPLSREV